VDDLEFRKSAIINPQSQDQHFLQKKQQSRSNQQFVSEQKKFNQQLSNTLVIPVPENLSERILLNQQLQLHQQLRRQKRQKQWRKAFAGAIAASLLVTFSSLLLMNRQVDSNQLVQQVIDHVHDDTHALNIHMAVPKTQIDTMLASYGGKLEGPIGQVSFLGRCIIGEQTGIHMVLNTDQGLVTVIVLPTQSIKSSKILIDGQYSGLIYPSQKGSIAIIAKQKQSILNTQQRLKQNLHWII